MFEDSLVESRVGTVSTGKRWTLAGSVAVQCLLAALVVAVPLLRPAALPIEIASPRVLVPVPVKPPVRVHIRQTASTASAVPSPANATARPLLPPVLPHSRPSAAEPEIANVPIGNGMGNPLADILKDGTGRGPAVTAGPARQSGPLHVSTGVTDGMLLSPIRPVYPPIARSAGVQGTVVVEAVISRTGRIESLRVISGPAMLRGAAVEAIRAAQYRPYLLNGQPTDVETTITVNFRMGG